MDNIRQYLKNGIAHFNHAQIPDYKRFGVEIIKKDKPVLVDLGKNAYLVKPPEYKDVPWSGAIKKGKYFYWYSKPLHNYYHTILDSLGCLFYYFELKYDYPELTLLVNKNHANLNKWPPFVKEVLDILNIEYEYTDENAVYENIYFGDTQNQSDTGQRISPKPGQFLMIDGLVRAAKALKLDVPQHDNIYISRRTKHNPNYSKDLIGEDNTQKRGCVNEDEIVDILSKHGFVEVFGENYTLAEKITMFSRMIKYVTFSGAGITNTLYRKKGFIGGISSPGLLFPDIQRHGRHIIYSKYYDNVVNIFQDTSFVDPQSKKYNNTWKINSIDNFRRWAKEL